MEAPSELLFEAHRGLKVGAPKGASLEVLEVAAPGAPYELPYGSQVAHPRSSPRSQPR